LLALSVQYYGKPQIISFVGKNNFYPTPDVDSAILKITKTNKVYDSDMFFRFARCGFSAKRKKLASNLANGLKIDKKIIEKSFLKLGISLDVRAQDLTTEKWLKIIDALKAYVV
jgi:16S rRNA (adenine1518-N6/adenine1519-N6)-dimethyltransferase